MIPPFTGGLHCGADQHLLAAPWSAVIPPFTGGLHCGIDDRPMWVTTSFRDPAVHRRAPLRLLARLAHPAAGEQ